MIRTLNLRVRTLTVIPGNWELFMKVSVPSTNEEQICMTHCGWNKATMNESRYVHFVYCNKFTGILACSKSAWFLNCHGRLLQAHMSNLRDSLLHLIYFYPLPLSACVVRPTTLMYPFTFSTLKAGLKLNLSSSRRQKQWRRTVN